MSINNKVTIHNVAKHAGVAISSVSRVLSDHPYVSAELRARVLAAVEALGYERDFLAHSLRRGSTDSVGFLVGSISNPVMADISVSIGNVLAKYGYAMLLACSQNKPELDVAYLQFLARRHVNGLIVSSAVEDPRRAAALVGEINLPTVMLDRQRPLAPQVSAVQSDHAGGMLAAVSHLLERGHRRIALISAPELFDPARARLAGFYEALSAGKVSSDPMLVRLAGMSKEVGYRETHALLDLSHPPSALIAGGNLILAGALQALQERKVQVGRDLALIGCDDTELTQLYSPAITVIARDLTLLGETAAQLLLDTIQQEGGKTITLPTQLVIRKSSLCSPKALP